MADRLFYTETQVFQYFRRIDFSHGGSLPKPDLDTLRRLVACHICAVPWENATLKYSEKHDFSLGKDEIFDKIINKRRGAVCLEGNLAFSTLLLTLGYDLYMLGTRIWVNVNQTYLPLTHLAIILRLEGIEYLVDVGFGGTGLTAPLPIFDGNSIMTAPIYGVYPEQHRIQISSIPGALNRDHKVWTLEHRQSPQAEWTKVYSFEKDVELLQCDLEMYVFLILSFDDRIKMYTTQHPDSTFSVFSDMLWCSRVRLNDQLEAVSRITLKNFQLREMDRCGIREIATFSTAEERLQAIKEFFGIKLTRKEKGQGIGKPQAMI